MAKPAAWQSAAGGPGKQPENNANLVFHRYYVTEGDWTTYRASGGGNELFTNLREPVSGRTLSSAWVQRNANTDDDDDDMNTLLVGGQARYFGGRLIGTFGLRRDELEIFNRGTKRDAVTDEYVIDYDDANATRYDYVARTKTFGAVDTSRAVCHCCTTVRPAGRSRTPRTGCCRTTAARCRRRARARTWA